MIVDELGMYRLKGKTVNDYNTMPITLSNNLTTKKGQLKSPKSTTKKDDIRRNNPKLQRNSIRELPHNSTT